MPAIFLAIQRAISRPAFGLSKSHRPYGCSFA
jgi:hypothetical protein